MTRADEAFTQLRPKRIPAQVAETIVAAIRRGDYPKGSRLPAERELAVTLGVSRSSLREALSSLDLAGIIDSHHGSGTTVTADGEQLAAWGQNILPPQVLEVRLLIEPELAALAASKRNPQTIRILKKALADLEAQQGQVGAAYNDHAFHRAVAEAAQNPILQRALEEALSYTTSPMWIALKDRALSRTGSVTGHLLEAKALVRAISDGDARAAAEIWRDHLVGYRREMLESSVVD